MFIKCLGLNDYYNTFILFVYKIMLVSLYFVDELLTTRNFVRI